MRKRRTREHIIADLSINHVERHALLAGYTAQRNLYDYGMDLTLRTYNEAGEIETGAVFFQIKATDVASFSADQNWLHFRVGRSDLESWLREKLPFILIVYDAQADRAYWLYVQAYFEHLPGFQLAQANRTITVRLPIGNIVSQNTMRHFAVLRDVVQNQYPEVIHYED